MPRTLRYCWRKRDRDQTRVQARISNRKLTDLFACRWLRARATINDSRFGKGGNDPRVLTLGAVIHRSAERVGPSYDAACAQDAFFRITFSLTIVVLPWYVIPLSQATL